MLRWAGLRIIWGCLTLPHCFFISYLFFSPLPRFVSLFPLFPIQTSASLKFSSFEFSLKDTRQFFSGNFCFLHFFSSLNLSKCRHSKRKKKQQKLNEANDRFCRFLFVMLPGIIKTRQVYWLIYIHHSFFSHACSLVFWYLRLSCLYFFLSVFV